MIAPELLVATRATADLVPLLGMDGAPRVVAIIKQRFACEAAGRVVPVRGAVLRRSDVPWDPAQPESSSVRYPSDVCLHKPATDVVVVGSAVAPGRAAVERLDVHVAVGPVGTTVRVWGPRPWVKGALRGVSLGRASLFEEVPLRWELAYGGIDLSDPRAPVEEPRNPVGRGVARDAESLAAKPGPQIEFPDAPITKPTAALVPAGVAPLGPRWAPRRDYAGTMDARWQATRMPLPPVDLDERVHQVAPPWLVAPGYLQGGEPVTLTNLHPDGPLRFALPRLAFVARGVYDRGAGAQPAVMDTVLLEPGERRFELTWRAALPAAGPHGRLRAVEIREQGARR